MTKPALEEQVRKRITRMAERFEGNNLLHEQVRQRQLHFHNDPSVDPFRMADGTIEPGKDNFTFAQMQTTRLRNVAVSLVGRLTENEWQPSIIPSRSTAAGQSDAETAEWILSQGFSERQKLTGLNIQSALAECLVRDCFGVLHWQVDTSIYSGAPDYDDEYDELPEDAGERKRYTDEDYPETVGRTKAKKYRESEDSLADRIARFRASKGLPVYCEVVPVRQFYFRLGKYSKRGQFLECMVKRQVAVEDWMDGKETLSDERDSPVEHEEGHEDTWQTSADYWGKTATLIQLWDDEYCYELLDMEGGPPMEVYPHPYKRPPFSLALGTSWHSTEPTFAYEPALAGMYRHKAQYDRWLSLFLATAESRAIARWWAEDKGSAVRPGSLMAEDGDTVIDLNPNGADAGVVPAGMELKSYGGDAMPRDFAESGQYLADELERAAPGTGRATFGASTQPWAARIEQAQENIEPKMYLENIAAAIQDMLQNIIEVFSLSEGGPGEVFSWGSGQGKKLDRSKTVSLKAEGWKGLIAEVNIDPTSSAEKITHEEHLRNLVNDPIIRMPRVEYFEKTGVPNPRQTDADWEAEYYVQTVVTPMLVKRAAVLALGSEFALSDVDGNLVGPGGEIVPPQQYAMGQVMQGRMRPQRGVQTTIPDMAGLAAPGTAQLAGMVG